MEVKATVQLTVKELFGFLMQHTYSTVASFIGIVLSIGGFAGFFYMLGMPEVNPFYLGALFATGMLFTVVQPIMLYSKAKKQVKKNAETNQPLQYTISKTGIGVTQGELSAFSNWEEIVKVTSTKTLVMLYTSRIHAYVIPKKDVAEKLDEFKQLIQENCEAGYIKLWK